MPSSTHASGRSGNPRPRWWPSPAGPGVGVHSDASGCMPLTVACDLAPGAAEGLIALSDGLFGLTVIAVDRVRCKVAR
jgi:hypothetical protein